MEHLILDCSYTFLFFSFWIFIYKKCICIVSNKHFIYLNSYCLLYLSSFLHACIDMIMFPQALLPFCRDKSIEKRIHSVFVSYSIIQQIATVVMNRTWWYLFDIYAWTHRYLNGVTWVCERKASRCVRALTVSTCHVTRP